MSAQLWISDIHKIFKNQNDIDMKMSKFKTISALGTIVNVERTGPNLYEGSNDKRPIVYHLDDGTGVIRIVHFVHDKVAKQRKMFNFDQGSGPMLEKLKRHCLIEGHLKTGTTVQVKGVPQIDQRRKTRSVFEPEHQIQQTNTTESEIPHSLIEIKDTAIHSSTEIKAFAVRTVNDPNDEIEHMILVDKLKRSELYSHLFQGS